ncbi:carboxymuconolactone decarboxylase family protein [Amycolatopsis palatopharyngis]|uniref:carboxymuconolactone decarboxylase family protein n=1 Tax=Amycolatopsis palatopharyngis TaxID=187982 RepID=UPI000E26D6E9|nr:carboxymuconolactone decarboxylase family protein [Amycolatopsis palatopharyngis]
MTGIPVRLALRRALNEVRYVSPVRPAGATGLVAAVYAQVERDFGMLAPPIGLHSPAPDVLAAGWIMLRESLVASGVVSRRAKETVATVVAKANECPYCVEVHGMALGAFGLRDEAAAIGLGRVDLVTDPGTRAVAAWAEGAELPAEMSIEAVPELVGVAVTFHYLSRMSNVFLGRSPIPAGVPASVRGTARALLGRLLRPNDAPPGASLSLLPETASYPSPSWTVGNQVMAAAFARADAAVDAAGGRVVPPRVRTVVQRELEAWDGQPRGMSRSWVEAILAELPEQERPVGRLCLLTAMASSQVDALVVEEFAGGHPGDRELVEAASWASLAAAKVLGTRLCVSHPVSSSVSDRERGVGDPR